MGGMARLTRRRWRLTIIPPVARPTSAGCLDKPLLPYFLPHIPSGVKPLSKARSPLRKNKSNRSTRHCPTASVGVRRRSPVFAFDCRDHVDERREAERV